MKQAESVQTLLAEYDGHVPRYTSYPPANHMAETLCPDDFAEKLRHLPENKPVSLYLHIPFCHSLCYYCGCNTKIVKTQSPIARYMATLKQEIMLAAQQLSSAPVVGQVHFGGGSPNYPETEELKSLLDVLRHAFKFTPQTQLHMECDPRLLTAEKIADYAHMGISRLSLGVQDFDPKVQRAINRLQPPTLIAEQMAQLKSHGITQINFDLIIGLPEQTPETVAATLEETIRMAPSRIAVFPYAHVPWMKKHQKVLEKYALPNAEQRFSMAGMVRQRLRQAGYVPIGMDHYAKPDDPLAIAAQKGTLRRNFQGYTEDSCEALLGFGLSAISQFPNAIFQNHADLKPYKESVATCRLPIKKTLHLSSADREIQKIIETLLCTFRLPANMLDRAPYINHHRIEEMLADGLVTFQDGLVITDKGRPFARVVAACFDPRQQPNIQQDNAHARAV